MINSGVSKRYCAVPNPISEYCASVSSDPQVSKDNILPFSKITLRPPLSMPSNTGNLPVKLDPIKVLSLKLKVTPDAFLLLQADSWSG